jgi:23S rRNA (pseudouridine1915-N3)-methyltransferase
MLVMRVRILWVGKTKNPALSGLAADYLARVNRMVACEVVEIRDAARARNLSRDELMDEEASRLAQAASKSGVVVALDEAGRVFSSTDLARWFETEMNRGTREIDFIIGGAEGLSPAILAGARLRLSLGRMTWTHEMCRVLLLEQVYRAFTIIRNLPYHK